MERGFVFTGHRTFFLISKIENGTTLIMQPTLLCTMGDATEAIIQLAHKSEKYLEHYPPKGNTQRQDLKKQRNN